MVTTFMHDLIFASTYGSGAYGKSTYNGTTLVAIGPLVLPNTGAGWTALIGIVLLAIGSALAMWMWVRRKRTV